MWDREREVKENHKLFDLDDWRNCVAIYKKGRLGDEQVWGRVRIRDSI